MTRYESRTFGPDETPDWLHRRAERSPERLALRSRAGDLTYGQLDDLASRAAGALAAQGVSAGDRVAALMPGGPDFAVLLHATLRLGAAIVPVNTRLSTQEMAFVLEDSAPRALVLGGSLGETGAPLARAAGIEALYAPALQRGAHAPTTGHRLSDLAALVYTSGTTGKPKGAMLTLGNFYHAAVTSALGLGTLPEDRWLLCMPLFHVGGEVHLHDVGKGLEKEVADDPPERRRDELLAALLPLQPPDDVQRSARGQLGDPHGDPGVLRVLNPGDRPQLVRLALGHTALHVLAM